MPKRGRDSRTELSLTETQRLKEKGKMSRGKRLFPKASMLLATAILAVSGLAGAPAETAPGTQQTIRLDSTQGLQPFGVRLETVTYRERKALRVVETPGSQPALGIAMIPRTEFGDGILEIDLAGSLAPGAPADARGFVGLAFRARGDGSRFEYVYLRPTNGRADDQLRRNHSTQYASHPDFPWDRLRKETPGVYESYVDLEPGAWTKMRIVVEGVRAKLYVNDAPQPCLIVNDLKLGETRGAIALWIGLGTEAYFSNLKITPAASAQRTSR